MSDGLGQLCGKCCPLNRQTGRFLPRTVHGVIPNHGAQHHFRVLRKIAVDGDAVSSLTQMHPVWLDVDRPIPLLQEEDVRGDLCAGIGAEGIVGQTGCAKQLRPLGDVFPHLRGLLVHGTLGRNKGHHAAGTHLFQRFR